jgi:hypothetical protein
MWPKWKNYRIETSFGLAGLAVATLLTLLLPKQYETAGELRVAFVDRLQLVEFVEMAQFLSALPSKFPGIQSKFFRLEQFKYLVKFQSNDPKRLAAIEKDFSDLIDSTFKPKFENTVGRKQSELDEVNAQIKTLQETIDGIERAGSKALADKYYLFQFKKMVADFVARRNLLQGHLSEDATKYFDYSVFNGNSAKQIFPKFAPLAVFSLFISLLLGFLFQKSVKGSRP